MRVHQRGYCADSRGMRNRSVSWTACTLPFLFCIASTVWGFGGKDPKDLRTKILDEARGLLGSSYTYGATGPSEFDCSGLVYSIYSRIADVKLPRRAENQWMRLGGTTKGSPEPGDLVFFSEKGKIFHVGISLGDAGFISALSEFPGKGVSISQLGQPYWRTRYAGYAKPVRSGNSIWLDYRIELSGLVSARPDFEVPVSDVAASLMKGFRILAGAEFVWRRLALGVAGGLEVLPAGEELVLPLAMTLGVDRRVRVSLGVKTALTSLHGAVLNGRYAPSLGASLVVLEIPAGSFFLGLSAGVVASLWRSDSGTTTGMNEALTESRQSEGRGLVSALEVTSKTETGLEVEFLLGLSIR